MARTLVSKTNYGSSSLSSPAKKVMANGSWLAYVSRVRRVGVGKERLTGSTAVGKKSAFRNKSGKPNDTDQTLPRKWSEKKFQVVGNDH